MKQTGQKKRSIEFKPILYRIYVDGILVFFESSESTHSFREYMFSKHQNINFSNKHDELAQLRFQKSKFVLKAVILSLVFTESQYLVEFFLPVMKIYFQRQKRGLLYTLLHKSFSISYDFMTFHLQINHLKTVFR